MPLMASVGLFAKQLHLLPFYLKLKKFTQVHELFQFSVSF